MTETYGSTFNKWDWEQRAQERAEWQDQFTMCGRFRWHLETEGLRLHRRLTRTPTDHHQHRGERHDDADG